MRKILLSICLICFSASFCYAGTFYVLCRVTTNLNIREGPSAQYDIITQIPKGAYFVAIVPDNMEIFEGMFVYGLYIDKDVYGYVSENYIDPIREIETDYGGVLSKEGQSYGFDPEIEITNSTNKNITVKVNDTNFRFAPRQVRTIACAPGAVSIFASSPGVIPYSATDYVSENSRYTWKFYIETTYR